MKFKRAKNRNESSFQAACIRPFLDQNTSQFIVETKSARQTFSPSAQNYEQIARDVAMDPLGGSPLLAKANAMAADATTSLALLVAGGIDSKGKKVQMVYDGKNLVVARWLSVQRAMMLANALGGYLGLTMDDAALRSAIQS